VTERHPRLLACAELDWQDGTPVSRSSGDIYFARTDGVRESRIVFLEGNELPRRLRTAPREFCIGETGFGTGLNFLLARRLFLDLAPPSARLHFVSFEHAPLREADRERFAAVLRARGETGLACDARQLSRQFPPPVAGWHRLVFDEGRVRLSLWLGDAVAGLTDWCHAAGRAADAWFLDGFAPSLNPELWAPSLARLVAARSRAGATLATFSVARSVRDALGDAGFALEKAPGPPGKREMLRGCAPGAWADPAPALPRSHVTVAGAGIAGATVARALAERGIAVRVLDPEGAATGASGNRHAVLHPRLPLDDGPRAAFLLAAAGFTHAWLERAPWAHAFEARPVLQFPERRRPERLERVRARFGDVDGHLRWHPGPAPLLEWPRGGRADLPALTKALLDHPAIDVRHEPLAPRHIAGERSDPLVLAAGAATDDLLDVPLGLGRMRGQLTRVHGLIAKEASILTGRGHAIPLADGWSVGSSYRRLDEASAPERQAPTAEERAENLERLRAWLSLRGLDGDPTALPADAMEDWVGVRANTPDRAPVVGLLSGGLWASTGHASSGLLTCPLAGEAIAAALCGEPPVFDAEVTALLAPSRLL
jgi:tRNA 5-methylaminomethyl-2-thiouridine biosynthesis bifunctional protein